jgi:hypothetical protein
VNIKIKNKEVQGNSLLIIIVSASTQAIFLRRINRTWINLQNKISKMLPFRLPSIAML